MKFALVSEVGDILMEDKLPIGEKASMDDILRDCFNFIFYAIGIPFGGDIMKYFLLIQGEIDAKRREGVRE